jgi:pyruvate kinase
LQPGDRIDLTDARGARRSMAVTECTPTGGWAESTRTTYVTPGLRLTVTRGESGDLPAATVGALSARPQTIVLSQGDELVLTRALDPGRPATYDDTGKLTTPARIGLTLPELFDSVRRGDPI